MALTDGSVIRGKMSLDKEKLLLEHPQLGTLRFNLSSINYLRRTPPKIIWLERLGEPDLKLTGPVAPPPEPEMIRSMHLGCDTQFLRAIRMMPNTTARYRLPKDGAEGKFIFRSELVPITRCRGEANVRISSAGKEVWKQVIDEKSEPAKVAIELPAGSEMTIEVYFGKRLAFPCGVDWRDAHLLSAHERVGMKQSP